MVYHCLPRNVMHTLILLAIQLHLNRSLQHLLDLLHLYLLELDSKVAMRNRQKFCHTHLRFTLVSCLLRSNIQMLHSHLISHLKLPLQKYFQVQEAVIEHFNRLFVLENLNHMQKDVAIGRSRRGG